MCRENRTFNAIASRQAAPARGSHWGGPAARDCPAMLAPRGGCGGSATALPRRRIDPPRRSGAARRTPPAALRFSAPHRSPLPGAACREGNDSGLRGEVHRREARRRAVPAGANRRRREAQGRGRRAQRASTSDSPQLSERSGRRPRSESCGAPSDRRSEPGHRTVPADCPVPGERPGACKRQGTQGSPAQRGRSHLSPSGYSPSPCRLVAPMHAHSGPSTSAMRRKEPAAGAPLLEP